MIVAWVSNHYTLESTEMSDDEWYARVADWVEEGTSHFSTLTSTNVNTLYKYEKIAYTKSENESAILWMGE